MGSIDIPELRNDFPPNDTSSQFLRDPRQLKLQDRKQKKQDPMKQTNFHFERLKQKIQKLNHSQDEDEGFYYNNLDENTEDDYNHEDTMIQGFSKSLANKMPKSLNNSIKKIKIMRNQLNHLGNMHKHQKQISQDAHSTFNRTQYDGEWMSNQMHQNQIIQQSPNKHPQTNSKYTSRQNNSEIYSNHKYNLSNQNIQKYEENEVLSPNTSISKHTDQSQNISNVNNYQNNNNFSRQAYEDSPQPIHKYKFTQMQQQKQQKQDQKINNYKQKNTRKPLFNQEQWLYKNIQDLFIDDKNNSTAIQEQEQSDIRAFTQSIRKQINNGNSQLPALNNHRSQ
eukprot:403345772